MLTLADVAKSYGTRELFSEVSLFVARTDRYGLVGPNGAGKSTLFNLILGEEQPDEGIIEWERGADFGFLPQESAPVGDETVIQIATSGKKLVPENDDDYDIDWTLEPRAKKILAGLGFREEDHDKPAKSFSGGWVMRAHLARLLVSEPALLLLDEPTNHLDLEALLWFQDYLTRYPGGLLIISHDREFLNTLCTGILELKGGTLNRYTGNYDDYLAEKDARKEQQAALFKNQQREIAHLQKFVDRFGAKASMASREVEGEANRAPQGSRRRGAVGGSQENQFPLPATAAFRPQGHHARARRTGLRRPRRLPRPELRSGARPAHRARRPERRG